MRPWDVPEHRLHATGIARMLGYLSKATDDSVVPWQATDFHSVHEHREGTAMSFSNQCRKMTLRAENHIIHIIKDTKSLDHRASQFHDHNLEGVVYARPPLLSLIGVVAGHAEPDLLCAPRRAYRLSPACSDSSWDDRSRGCAASRTAGAGH